MKKLLAFTLAETLIVIGIIGVVSALTLPNLNSSTGEKEKVAKVKKLYQNLDDAIGRAIAVYGPVDEWFVNDTTEAAKATRFAQRVAEFMKVSKNCGLAVNTGCFTKSNLVSYLNPSSEYAPSPETNGLVYKIILSDGTSVGFEKFNGDLVNIAIDIDGPNKGKNTIGIDRFAFTYTENVLHPGSIANHLVSPSAGDTTVNYSVELWILTNDNMDYLKCNSDLKWYQKTSCK